MTFKNNNNIEGFAAQCTPSELFPLPFDNFSNSGNCFLLLSRMPRAIEMFKEEGWRNMGPVWVSHHLYTTVTPSASVNLQFYYTGRCMCEKRFKPTYAA